MNNQLTLRDGKFYRNGEEVPIQLGDSEQIALVKEHERRAEAADRNGIECDIGAEDLEYTAICEFECICGRSIEKSIDRCEVMDARCVDDEAVSEFDKKTISCQYCKREYIINDGYAKLLKASN